MTRLEISDDAYLSSPLAAHLKHIPECKASLEKISTFDAKQSLRMYVRELITNGRFSVVSPTTGQLTQSGTSIVLNDKSVFFSLRDDPSIFIGASNLGRGFPLTSIVLLAEDLLLVNGDAPWGATEEHVAQIRRIISRNQWMRGVDSQSYHLVFGDPNFAHVAWNQLPALRSALQLAAQHARRLDIVSTHEPLGPLQLICSPAKYFPIVRTPSSYLEQQNHPGAVFIPLGSTRIGLQTRDHILRSAWLQNSESANSLLARMRDAEGPVFWLSVRTRNRTIVDQHLVLSTLAISIFREFANSLIVFDGHSIPVDLQSNKGGYDSAGIREIVAQDAEEVDRIIRALPENFRGCAIPAVGMTVTESIIFGQFADFYICHHGTVQHKIGWFSASPGIIHSNLRTLALKPAQWVSSQSEIAQVPVYLPEEFVTDGAAISGTTGLHETLRLENYAINNAPAMAEFVIGKARDFLRTSGRYL